MYMYMCISNSLTQHTHTLNGPGLGSGPGRTLAWGCLTPTRLPIPPGIYIHIYIYVYANIHFSIRAYIHLHMYIYIHLPSAFPTPCLIGASVFGMSGMMGRLAALAGLAELVDGPIDRFIPWVSGFIYGCLGDVLVPSRVMLESILDVFWWSWGCFGDPGLPRFPKGGRAGKVTEKAVCGSFVGPPPRPSWEPKSTKNREKVVPRSTLENNVCKVLHKRCLGTPSNHENGSSVDTKP